ncbi:MAG: class II fumarate hydratase [Candidatus Bipolaricaulia bacterium]
MDYRVDHDSLGEVQVPRDAYWGAQTQRAVENFPVSDIKLQSAFVRAQAIIKRACAQANMDLDNLDASIGQAIVQAAEEVMDGQWHDQFVVDVYQAGAGTSQNMNANEVIANRAIEILGGEKGEYSTVHPNDHVNRGQSTNDTMPTAIHISALEEISHRLIPALENLRDALQAKADEFDEVVKSGRTHLQDAVPMRLGQEFGAYARMIELGVERVQKSAEELKELAIGGNAVGTGINTPEGYKQKAVDHVNEATDLGFRPADDPFEAIQNRDAAVNVSGALRTVATSLTKIADDFRLLSSGPKTGLREINLPAVQPGSSIMPGKVNPVLAEMLNMIAFGAMGCDQVVSRGGQAGQLELNVMMPVMGYYLLHEIEILSNGARAFNEKCVQGVSANEVVCQNYAESTPQVVTALSPYIGYEKAAEVLKKALDADKSIREVVLAEGLLPEDQLNEAMDLKRLT